MFKIGQKVVCITGAWKTIQYKNFVERIIRFFVKGASPAKDEIVTISMIGQYNVLGKPMLLLELKGYGDELFDARMFRPLDEQFAEDVCEIALRQAQQEQLEKALELTA